MTWELSCFAAVGEVRADREREEGEELTVPDIKKNSTVCILLLRHRARESIFQLSFVAA